MVALPHVNQYHTALFHDHLKEVPLEMIVLTCVNKWHVSYFVFFFVGFYQVEDFLQSLTCEDIAMTTLQKALYNLESEVDNVPFDIIHKEQVKNKITALRERLKKHERKMKKVTIFKVIFYTKKQVLGYYFLLL